MAPVGKVVPAPTVDDDVTSPSAVSPGSEALRSVVLPVQGVGCLTADQVEHLRLVFLHFDPNKDQVLTEAEALKLLDHLHDDMTPGMAACTCRGLCLLRKSGIVWTFDSFLRLVAFEFTEDERRALQESRPWYTDRQLRVMLPPMRRTPVSYTVAILLVAMLALALFASADATLAATVQTTAEDFLGDLEMRATSMEVIKVRSTIDRCDWIKDDEALIREFIAQLSLLVNVPQDQLLANFPHYPDGGWPGYFQSFGVRVVQPEPVIRKCKASDHQAPAQLEIMTYVGNNSRAIFDERQRIAEVLDSVGSFKTRFGLGEVRYQPCWSSYPGPFTDDNYFDFNFITSIKSLWKAKAYLLTIWVVAWSLVWPFIKISLQLMCWAVPFHSKHRRRVLLALEILGHFALADVFMLSMVMVGMKLYVGGPLLARQTDGPRPVAGPDAYRFVTDHPPDFWSDCWRRSLADATTDLLGEDVPRSTLYYWTLDSAAAAERHGNGSAVTLHALGLGVEPMLSRLPALTFELNQVYSDKYRVRSVDYLPTPAPPTPAPTPTPVPAATGPPTIGPSVAGATSSPSVKPTEFALSVDLFPGAADYLFLAGTIVSVLWGTWMARRFGWQIFDIPAESPPPTAVVAACGVGISAVSLVLLHFGLTEDAFEFEIGGLSGQLSEDPVKSFSVTSIAKSIANGSPQNGGRKCVAAMVWLFVVATPWCVGFLSLCVWASCFVRAAEPLRWRLVWVLHWMYPFSMADIYGLTLIMTPAQISKLLTCISEAFSCMGPQFSRYNPLFLPHILSMVTHYDADGVLPPVFKVTPSVQPGSLFLLCGALMQHAAVVSILLHISDHPLRESTKRGSFAVQLAAEGRARRYSSPARSDDAEDSSLGVAVAPTKRES